MMNMSDETGYIEGRLLNNFEEVFHNV
jgi:hypothetical protein